SSDFAANAIHQIFLLGEPLVLYRTQAGDIAALEDRCCHRAAPLSKGRREGDDLRCMYHGIKFGPGGQCTELPGQSVIPAAVRVRSYPVAERHGAIWVWMGDPAKADAALIPDFIGPDNADWAVATSHLDIAAEAQLLIDNLLDVSHAPYVHEATFAAGNRDNVARMVRAEQEARVTRLDRGVNVERWIVGREDNPFLDGITTDDFAFNQVNVPGIFTMYTYCFPTGTFQRTGEMRLPDETPLLARFVGQIITPVADGRCKLYYAAGPWQAHAAFRDQFFSTVTTAFQEDEDIIVAQQTINDALPDRAMMTLNMDGPLTRYANIVRKLMQEEVTAVG
ncbi:MAG: hypothetical protein B7Z20_05050, partial [Sphingobium sp. 32-64-5]